MKLTGGILDERLVASAPYATVAEYPNSLRTFKPDPNISVTSTEEPTIRLDRKQAGSAPGKTNRSEDSDDDIEVILRPDLQSPQQRRATPRDGFATFLDQLLKRSNKSSRPRFSDLSERSSTPFSSSFGDLGSGSFGDHGPSGLLASGLLSSLSEILTKLPDSRRANDGNNEDKSWHPLHFAAQRGSLPMCRALLSKGSRVDPLTDEEATPLMIAAQNGHLDVVRLLVERGANTNAQSKKGRSALFQAAVTGELEILRYLVAHHADANIRDCDGNTLLVAACIGYLKHRSDDRLDIVRLFMEAGSSPNNADDDGTQPLQLACVFELEDLARVLIESGADVNAKGRRSATPLCTAANDAHVGLVRLLLDHGADPNAREQRQWTPLHLAAQNLKPGTCEVMRLLVNAGTDVNATMDTGATAMHLVAQEGNLDGARILIGAGADVNVLSSKHRTPIFSAVGAGNLELLDLLLAEGALLDVLDEDGFNIVHLSAMQQSIKVAERVLALGLDINLRATYKRLTPLHLATQNDNEEMVQVFLDHGAEV